MSVRPAWPLAIDFFPSLPIVLQPADERLSHDGGPLLFRQLDESLALTRDFAAALDDPRAPNLRDHSFLGMVRQRVYGILAGHEDQNDAGTLRSDPVLKLVRRRRPDDGGLASQPTLSRFENSISIASLKRLRQAFADQFIASFPVAPRRLALDLDAVDDPAHGSQQLAFWHDCHDQDHCLPLVVSCAENDLLVSLSLRHGSAHAASGADDDLGHVVARLRAAWPCVSLHARADAASGIPAMHRACERPGVSCSFGLTGNAVLERESETLLARAVAAWEAERRAAREQERPAVPARLFDGFWYRASGWEHPRWVVAKAEADEQGSQRRFVGTDRPGAQVLPGAAYDGYAARGESEDRFKLAARRGGGTVRACPHGTRIPTGNLTVARSPIPSQRRMNDPG